METTLVILGAILWGMGIQAHLGYMEKARTYRKRMLSKISKEVDEVHSMEKTIPQEEYLSKLYKVLHKYSSMESYSKAPRNLLLGFSVWGASSIFVGLSWGSLGDWFFIVPILASGFIITYVIDGIIGIVRMGEEYKS